MNLLVKRGSEKEEETIIEFLKKEEEKDREER